MLQRRWRFFVKRRESILGENMYSTIYDNMMKLLVQHRITPDGLEEEISKMQMMFAAYYPDEDLDKEAL